MEYFKDRALFYASFPIRDQGKRGKWDFNLEPVYLVAIQDFILDLDMRLNKDVKIDVMLKDQHGDIFYDKLHFCFIQMPMFQKKVNQLETHFDKWLFFLKNLENFDRIPDIFKEPVFEKGFEIARLANFDSREKIEYNASVKKYQDMMNVVETAKKEGRIEGNKENALKVAKAMIEDNMPIAQIIKYSGLTQDEIEKLIKSRK